MPKRKSKTAKKAAGAVGRAELHRRRQRQNRITNYPGGPGSRNENGEPIGPEPPSQPGAGGTGGGGGGTEPHDDLGIPGLPPEIAAKIHEFFISGRDDWKEQAIQYLMGTAWFKQEYAGYDVGYTNGMFSDPLSGGLARYRQYKTNLQGIYQQYYGRPVTVNDITAAITQGWDEGRVSQSGQSYTTIKANQGEWNYLSGAFGGGQLSEAEKQAYGDELAGVDTILGQQIKAKVDNALQRMQRVFQGQTASSALGDQALASRIQKKPDIQA